MNNTEQIEWWEEHMRNIIELHSTDSIIKHIDDILASQRQQILDAVEKLECEEFNSDAYVYKSEVINLIKYL